MFISSIINTDLAPATPAKANPKTIDSESQKHLKDSVSQNWERQETGLLFWFGYHGHYQTVWLEEGIPYYINHLTETTTWNHPKLQELTLGLKTLNAVKFSAYRTAMKLRKIQKTLALDVFKIDHMQKAFR